MRDEDSPDARDGDTLQDNVTHARNPERCKRLASGRFVVLREIENLSILLLEESFQTLFERRVRSDDVARIEEGIRRGKQSISEDEHAWSLPPLKFGEEMAKSGLRRRQRCCAEEEPTSENDSAPKINADSVLTRR